MIEVKGLVKYYGERKVLHGLDFSVAVGRICGFLGPNGSGKSTTMDILAGILGPSDGDAKICGFSVLTQTEEAKARIGYLPDNPPLYEEMTVHDFVDYVARLRKLSGEKRRSAVERVLDECDVEGVSDRVIGHLSKGYKQRVALCASLVHQPEVLILDEPTEGLDPTQIVLIRNLIRKLSKDRTVILSSHILSEVQATCDDVIVINQGSIVARTSLSEEREKSSSYIFTFAANVDRALAWFNEKNFVSNASIMADDRSSIIVDFRPDFWKDGDLNNVAKVNSLLVQQTFPVIGIREHKVGIESLFFDAIKSQGMGLDNASSDAALKS